MAPEHDRLALDVTITGASPAASGTLGNLATFTSDAPATHAPSDAPLPPLRPVDVDRYELRGEHGRGGLGVVMRALDRQLGREVAIKLLQNPSPAAAQRFLREATITSRLQHPNIVTVLDVVRWIDGSPCYTMPLYPGQSLRVAIDGSLDLGARLAMVPKVLAIADAVAHAHGRGVIHRDLKPSNVLLGSLGEVVVIDWGLARRIDGPDAQDADEGQVQGTPAYMAPEQARGEAVDRRADVYSLGALLYHVLAGRTPYDAGSTAEALVRLREGPPPDLAAIVPGVPSDLVAIVRKAMARAPEERYADAAGLAGDLDRFLAGNLVEARAYSTAQLAWRFVVRHRLLLASFAAIVLVLAFSLRSVQRQRGLAVAAARHEAARADAMILTQAQTALVADPTDALAYLKTYPLAGEDWPTARRLARDAVRRGVARHVLYRQEGVVNELFAWDHGRRALLLDGRRTLVLWDPGSGAKEHVCLPDDLRGSLRDETFGHELATLLVDGRVLVWNEDLSASTHVATLPGALDVSLSSDGRYLVALLDSGLVTLVDRATSATTTLAEGAPPLGLGAFVPGTHRVLLVDDERRAQLYDVDERRVVYDSTPGVGGYAIAHDGHGVVLVRSGRVEWLDAVTLASSARPAKLSDYARPSFLPDGRVLLTDERSQRTEIWSPVSGAIVTLPFHATTAAASPDGTQVAGFDGGVVDLVDLASMGVRELHGHGRHNGTAIAWLEGGVLATLVDEGNARLWDVAPPAADTMLVGKPGYEPPTFLIVASQTLLVAAQDGTVSARQLPDGKAAPRFRVPGRVFQLVATPDGATVLAVTLRGEVYRSTGAAPAAPELLFSVGDEIDRLRLGDDGRHAIALSARSSTGYVWDLVARRSRAFTGLDGNCDRVALSADDRVGVFNCSIDEREGLTVVDLESGAARVLPMPATIVSLLGFTPSGRYLYAVSRAGRLLRWEVATGALATREVHLAEGDDGDVLDEDLVYSTGADGLVLTMFSTGVSHVVDPTPDVRFFALSPDRRFAAGTIAAELHGIRLWDLASGESWSVPTSRGVRRPSFTADGHVITSGRDGMIRIYPPPRDLRAAPAATRAWLDRQTSVRVGDSLLPRPVCP